MTQSAKSQSRGWKVKIPFSQRCLRRVPSFPRNTASRYLRLSLLLVATGTRRGLALTSDGPPREMVRVVAAVAVVTLVADSLGARVGVIGSTGMTGRAAGMGDNGWMAMILRVDREKERERDE